MNRAAWSLTLIMLTTSAPARDDGRYANSHPIRGTIECASTMSG